MLHCFSFLCVFALLLSAESACWLANEFFGVTDLLAYCYPLLVTNCNTSGLGNLYPLYTSPHTAFFSHLFHCHFYLHCQNLLIHYTLHQSRIVVTYDSTEYCWDHVPCVKNAEKGIFLYLFCFLCTG